jgi:hypothetical protein
MSGTPSSALNMVGTPANTVARWPAMSCSACLGSNLGSSARLAPDAIAAFSVQVWPKEWNSGRPPKMMSAGESCTRSVFITSVLVLRLACVSSAPLGWPVVPEV